MKTEGAIPSPMPRATGQTPPSLLARRMGLSAVLLVVALALAGTAVIEAFIGWIWMVRPILYASAALGLLALVWVWLAVAALRKPRADERPRKWRRALITAVNIVIGLLVLPWMPFSMYTWTAPLVYQRVLWPVMRWRMEAIVKQVCAKDFKGDAAFRISTLGDVTPWGETTPNNLPDVRAHRDDDGSLTVSILVFNRGNLGRFGYVYADKAPGKAAGHMGGSEEDGRTYLDFHGPMRAIYPGGRINDHWWNVFDDEY
ncbi:MAG TPA: hypothetical protein VG733_07445 [Chthoniobacteraceae bacterium]|nr:hypothetical protein [Chthoniobacteraceae bacterium]